MGLVLLQEGELCLNDIALRIRLTSERIGDHLDVEQEVEGLVLIVCSVDPEEQPLGSLDGCLFCH